MPKISEEQRQARLSAGAVYLYYESKDELILAAISTYMGELRKLLMPTLMREKALAPVEFVREITAAISTHTRRTGMDLNAVILMCWGEAQSNGKIKALITEFQRKYREALAAVASQWQQRGELPMEGKATDIAKTMLSLFLGFIVQSALLGEIDPDTAARGISGLIGGKARGKANPRSRRARQTQVR
jgi:TetR/AcrR family transcriptional regulator, transcriptional repressor of aconitase